MSELTDMKIAFIATDGVEQIELTEPWQAVKEADGKPVLIAPASGTIQGFDKLEKDQTFEVNVAIEGADPGDYDGLVLPGGVVNPDRLRTNENVVDFIRSFHEQGKPIAVICHGPWTLIEAGVVDGRDITSWPSVRTDLVNAGARWTDEEVVVCRNGPILVSSRKPEDLPAFNKALVQEFSTATVSR